MRTHVYIDGFNLYYGAVKGTPFKWLDVVKLAKQLVPADHDIERVKYFTARVSGLLDRTKPGRQEVYLAALRTLPEVEIIFGRYLSKTIWRPLVNLPIADATVHTAPPVTVPRGVYMVRGGSLQEQKRLPVGVYGKRQPDMLGTPLADALIAEAHTFEEKGSDVNLGAHLINDAWRDAFDSAVVITNDTDLATPIRMVSAERRKPVYVVCPGKWVMSTHLERVATYKRHIRRAMLTAAQFPDPIPGTTIRKPANW